jgi:hypothetical protein
MQQSSLILDEGGNAMLKDTKQANSATTAVTFITVGALMAVWSAVYYVYLNRHESGDFAYLWVYGFFFSGLVLIGIGIGLGHIGRVVRDAEVTTTTPTVPAAPVAAAPANGVVPPAAPVIRQS